MTPNMSCVIPARDAEDFLREAVDSALGQHYPADRTEVVVVDDGSVDLTPDILLGYGDRIRTLRHEDARGVDAAVEAGMAACAGELVHADGRRRREASSPARWDA